MDSSRIRRERMVRQLEGGGIKDRRVLDAMLGVPRHDFVEEALQRNAYGDAALPIGEKQTISQPWIVARMCELAMPDGQGRALEIGTGSGYHAAVLSALYERVYSVERIADLSRTARQRLRELEVENVHFKIFDGTYGWSEFAPFRAILVTAGSPEVPSPLFDQLEEGGRVVIPLARAANNQEQTLVRVTKRNGEPVREEFGDCRFVPLVGRFGWKS